MHGSSSNHACLAIFSLLTTQNSSSLLNCDFSHLSETNLTKLWFYSYLHFVLKDKLCCFYLKVQPKGLSCIWANPNTTIQLHWIHSLSSCLIPHQFWNICIPTPPPPMSKTTMVTTNNQNIYMFGAFVSISQSSSVLQLFPWKEIFQTKKTEAYFIVLFCNRPNQ